MIARLRRKPALLWLVPAATYCLSYAYLAWYHGRPFLFSAVVHESGRYTLLETSFYAPHFLGHIPVLATLAMLMVGAYRWLSPTAIFRSRTAAGAATMALILLVGCSVAVSVVHWGAASTWEFILQQRQRPDLLVPGGSWLLHLPSTLSLVIGVPVTILGCRWFFRRPIRFAHSLPMLFLAGVVAIPVVTFLTVPQPLSTAIQVLTDPRYLAHSVRELATFPLTYFPLPIAWWLAREPVVDDPRPARSTGVAAAAILTVFVVLLVYHVTIPVTYGIAGLAQSPDFARGGSLSIPYLLASHYFEHFLDTIFFFLVCVLMTPRNAGAPT